jgi:translin
MDEIYAVLVTMDYPDAITFGLRRMTDLVRGILERTRGDMTVSLREEQLTKEMANLHKKLTELELNQK